MSGVSTLIIDGIWARPPRWEPLRALIEQNVGLAQIFTYDSSGRVSFETLGRELATHVHAIQTPVNLIGFSMGGLLVRAACMLDSALRVQRVVFLNSPHRGSWLAHLLPLNGIRQMRPRNEFIQQVRAARWPFPTLSIWNPLDTMVVPGWYTRCPAAQEQHLCPVPIHIWPIWSRSIHRRIVRFLVNERETEALTSSA
jgi:pimeloyl-ACP methyl ester carboxylesterase